MTNLSRRNLLIPSSLPLLVLFVSTSTPTACMASLVGSNFLNDSLVAIDPVTGVGSVIGPFGGGFGFVLGLAYDRNTDTLFGVDQDPNNRLININPATGAATAVGPLGVTGLQGLTFDPNTNTLYGSTSGISRLVTINTATGAASVVGFIGFDNVFGLGFDPNTNTLYGAEAVGSRRLLTIDTTTGAGTVVGATGISGGFTQLGGLDFDPDNNILYGVVDDFDLLVNNRLLTIDTSTGLATPLLSQLGFEGTQGLAVISSPPAVPEPSTAALACLGLLALRRPRRQK